MCCTDATLVQQSYQAEAVSPASDSLRNDLYNVVQTIATKFGWEVKGRPLTPSILKIITSNACERRISFELRNRGDRRDEEVFDTIFAEKHSFSVRFVLGRIITRLQEENIRAAIAGEVRDFPGIYDVTIEVDPRNPICTIRVRDVPRIKLEFKSSNSIELEQLQRYLIADSSPLVLIRCTFGQVSILRPEALSAFVETSIQEITNKARRALGEDSAAAIAIPGRDCWGCRNAGCEFAPERRGPKKGIVKLYSAAFDQDLNRLFYELPHVADIVADIVVKELQTKCGVPSA